MKKYLALSLFVLGSLAAHGSQSRAPYQSQFNVPKATKAAKARAQAKFAVNPPKSPTSLAKHPRQQVGTKATKVAAGYSNSQSSTSVSTFGMVSATQIPSGGAAYNQGYMGDFNGDGKKDLLTVVETDVNNSTVYSISTVLGNGNGTFKPAVLTTVSNPDPILIGDVNGDGKDDVVQVHPGNTPSTADVWLSNGDGTFKQGSSYQISPASLQGGLLTDVNGDGKLDMLAVDSQVPGLVRTLLGNGDGTFQAATSVTLATQAPSDLVFADFNGDGKVDFAGIANGQANIYLQEGGNFVLTGNPLVTSDNNYSICDMASGDLNGDGKAELVTANCDSSDDNTITIYVNNGDGTFATGVYYADANSPGSLPANLYPEAVTVADVNGDGKADVIVTNDDGSDVTILLGNGDGTVKVPNIGYATGGYAYVPALVADFNGDGLADIIQIDDEYSYAYLQGYGDGTFRAALDYYGPVNNSSGWPESVSVVTADLNGDGFPDFVVGDWDWDFGATGFTVFLSRGDGSLLPGVSYDNGQDLEFVVLGDFNGDGKLDVAGTSWDNNDVQVFFGNGDGTFTYSNAYPTGAPDGSCPYQLVTGDFNHDQHTDVAVAIVNCWEEGSNSVGVLLNDGTGGFQSPSNYALSNWGAAIAAGDLKGNGYSDLLVPLSDTDQVAILMANTDNSGTFQAETDITLVNGNTDYWNPEWITVADFNGDGKPDFAVSIYGFENSEQGIAVALGNGDGTFQTPSLYSTTMQDYGYFDSPDPVAVQAADMNGDGILDLVYTNDNYSTAGVLLGNGNGTFGLPTEFPVGSDAVGLAIADVNGDGALDIVTADDDAQEVTVLLNAMGSAEKPDYLVTASTSTATVKAGDSATYNLTVTGKNGYTSAITFSCSGLPAKAACSFNPAKVTTAGNDPKAVVLTITTKAATTTTASVSAPVIPGSNSRSEGGMLLASLSGLGVFGLGFVVAADGKKRTARQMAVVLGILLLVMTFTLVGCSGVSSSGQTTPVKTTVAGTPAGSYTVKVTSAGTGSNAPTHSMNITLVVQ